MGMKQILEKSDREIVGNCGNEGKRDIKVQSFPGEPLSD